ncbi:MAG: immunoglobulin domain-containing protein [Phycisphaeraceae bacterium]|nr:immunoglobulin domain-containing protein [Phycisphaeraceae bacterium]
MLQHIRSMLVLRAIFCTALAAVSTGSFAADPEPCAGAVMDEFAVPDRLGVLPHSVVLWDPDGDGPRLPQILIQDQGFFASLSGDGWRVIASAGTTTGLHIVDLDGWGTKSPDVYLGGSRYWSGDRVRSIHGGLGSSTNFFGFDPDGPGGENYQLIAAVWNSSMGGFYRPSRRSGASWLPLGTARSSTPIRFAAYDRDMSGPQLARLFAFGTFLDEFAGHSVLMWDGSAWSIPGQGLNGAVNDFVIWDRDGSGPIVPYLVVGGVFTASGSDTSVRRLAKWNGISWTAVSAGSGSEITALGVAPLPDSTLEGLIVAGKFTSIGGVVASRIATFDGTTWRSIGEGLPSAPSRLAAISAHGSLRDRLIVVTTAGSWDGYTWKTARDPVPNFRNWQWRTTATQWDPDGPGPERNRIAAIDYVGSVPYGARVLTFDGDRWGRLPFDVTGATVNALASLDPDGTGQEGNWLILGGKMGGYATSGLPDGSPIHNLLAWTGASLLPLGPQLRKANGAPATVHVMSVWDPDGTGPLNSQLFVAGDFTRDQAGMSLSGIARWTPTGWEPLGGGVLGSVTSMLPWDPDASGPQPTMLLVAGDFILHDVQGARNLGLWDGSAWHAFPGVEPPVDRIDKMTIWNRDGPGPEPRMPVIGFGQEHTQWYDEYEDVFYNIYRDSLLRWSGAEWEEVVYWSSFTSSSGHRYNYAGTMQQWDPDGAGPKPPVIALGGLFESFNNNPWTIGQPAVPFNTDLFAFWQDDVIDEWGEETDILDLVSFDIDGAGPVHPALVAFGHFEQFSVRWAAEDYEWFLGHDVIRLMDGAPQFRDQPAVLTPNPATRTIAMSCRAIGPGRVAYKWFRNGVEMSPGTTAWGSIVHSVDQPALVISNASPADDGAYVCRVSNACGSTDSVAVMLSVRFGETCEADYNNDGIVDILDLLDFIEDFASCEQASLPCGVSGEPDLNRDGVIDILDLLQFVDAFASGC